MEEILNASERTEKVKKLRKMGFVPGCLCGPGVSQNLYVQFEEKELLKFLRNHSRGSRVHIKAGDTEIPCVISNIQYDVLSGSPINIDLYASSEDKVVRVRIPLKFKGKDAVAKAGFVLNIYQEAIEIQGLLKDLPTTINIDVSGLKAGNTMSIAEIPLPDGVKLLSREEDVIVKVSMAAAAEQGDEAAS